MIWRNVYVALLLLGAFTTGTAHAAGMLDININDNVVEAKYGSNIGTGQLTFGGLYHDVTHDWLAHVGFLGRGESSTSFGRTEAGIGGRIYGGPAGPSSILALALGGEFTLYPENWYIGFGGYGFVAPNVLSARDTTGLYDVGARVEIEVIKRTGIVYIGYRHLRAAFSGGGHASIDESAMIGLRIGF